MSKICMLFWLPELFVCIDYHCFYIIFNSNPQYCFMQIMNIKKLYKCYLSFIYPEQNILLWQQELVLTCFCKTSNLIWIKLKTKNNFPDLPNWQPVWNLQHKFHPYLIYWCSGISNDKLLLLNQPTNAISH